ncbi:putative bifunctional diguanylate cyclase/phosphodiesterase [Pseudomonas sp. SP16.1]|uniref:putative bifunctional diguanylate cyclase/phosphodiesterase n=1 Tax=Pseudomonas sp. SP16.1 TaxID=3458854 RepID=UPI00404653AB
MKSHPDAGPRPAAEVVTQLPVPSRLGMLRFERLNEPSWALLFLDPACERQLGISASDLCALVDAPYASLMEPEARYRLHDAIQQQLLQGVHYLVRYRLHTPQGALDMLELGEAFKQHNRQLLRGYLLVADASLSQHAPRSWRPDEIAFAGELAEQVLVGQQQRSATQALHLFRRAVEQSASAFLLVDRDGRVEYVNPSFTAITLYSSDEVCGRRLAELPALVNLSDLLFDARSSLAEHNSWQGEFRSRRKNQEPYWGHLSISKVYGDDGALTHYIGIYEDITEAKQAQQRIERLAYTDNLTNLGNRLAFIRSLEERFARSPQQPPGLLLVDIDNFKRINDSLGHQTGDKLLAALARRLRNSLGAQGSLARFASNEFAILLDNNDQEAGQRVAQLVLQTLDKPLFVDNQLISITGSLGLALAPQHGDDPQTLMKHAGLALHKAKANGKHQVQLFTEALNAEANYKLFVENNLRRALTQNELEVFYQPKLCLKSGQLQGMEALLRWQHPEKGMIRPDQFIGVAEETGLIIPIGKWVVRQACRMSRQIAAIGLGELQVAINLSPKQFSDPDLVGSIAAILHEEQLDPRLLELELTESLLLEATEDTRHQLGRLKSLGLTLAMDDFGTGYSSLSYLKKFPIDVIKIDRSFIKDIPGDQDDMEITSAVIAMAHNLKLKVVAEGIETAAQLGFLRRQQCDVGQGYLFDRPIPGRELIDSLRRYPCRPSVAADQRA